MILSATQIQTLLSQGAITDAQAQSLAAANQGGANQETEQQTSFVDNSAMNAPIPKDGGSPQPAPEKPAPQASPAPQAPQQQQSGGFFNSAAYNASLASHPVQAARGNPAVQAPPAPEPSDQLKGQNSLTANQGATSGVIPASQHQEQMSQQRNDPARLMIPKASGVGMDLSPERKFLKAENEAGEGANASLSSQREAQANINDMQAVANDTAANIATKNAEAIMKAQDDNKAAWGMAMQKVDQQTADIASRAREVASRKIDPNHYWNSMDNASYAVAQMQQFFGAFGAALTKTPNFALEKVKMAIQNDVDAQKMNIESAYKGLGIEQDEAHTSLQKAQLDAAFKDKEIMQRWELLKQHAQGLAQRAQTPIDKQKANLMLSSFDDQIRQNRLGMAQNLYNFEVLKRKAENSGPAKPNESEIRKYVTDQKEKFMEKGDNEQDANDRAIKLASERFGLSMSGGQATLPTLEDDKTRQAKNEKDKITINLPTGEKAEARSESAANEYNKRQLAAGQLAKIIKGMKDLRVRNSGGTLKRADVAEAQSLQEQAVNAYNELTGFNRAPGSPERTGLKGTVIPDASDYSPAGAVDRKIESLGRMVQNAYDLNNKTYLKEPPISQYDIINGTSAGSDFAASIGAKPIGR